MAINEQQFNEEGFNFDQSPLLDTSVIPFPFSAKKNNAHSTLFATHVLFSGTVAIQPADEARFPSSYPFRITVYKVDQDQGTGTIFNVNSANGNVFNVTIPTDESPGSVDQTFDIDTGTFNVELDWTFGTALEYENFMHNHNHDGVSSALLADESVDTAQLADGAVTAAKMSFLYDSDEVTAAAVTLSTWSDLITFTINPLVPSVIQLFSNTVMNLGNGAPTYGCDIRWFDVTGNVVVQDDTHIDKGAADTVTETESAALSAQKVIPAGSRVFKLQVEIHDVLITHNQSSASYIILPQ